MSAADKTPSPTPGQVSYSFDCFTNRDGTIEMELRKATESLAKWVLDTRNTSVRDSLIKLGWTPPGEWPKKFIEAAQRGEGCGCRNCLDCSAYHIHYNQESFNETKKPKS